MTVRLQKGSVSMYYMKEIKMSDFSLHKIKRLYGILKAFKSYDNLFSIESKSGKYRLTNCSFLILMSLCGLNEVVTIKLYGVDDDLLEYTKKQLERIA